MELKNKVISIESDVGRINPKDFSPEQKALQLKVKNVYNAIEKEAHKQYVELGKIYRSKEKKPTPPKPTPSPTPSPIPNPTPTDNSFYVAYDNSAQRWVNENPNHKDLASIAYIAKVPAFNWLGNWNTDVRDFVARICKEAKAQGKIALFIIYNIPGRDNGSHSSGGAGSPEAYRKFVMDIVSGIDDAKAWVIVEPDASALSLNLNNPTLIKERFEMLNTALDILRTRPNVKIGIDASHPEWIQNVDELVPLLRKAGLDRADFVSINVSNFVDLSKCEEYARKIFERTGKRSVIDTSRNGNGTWSNPNNEAEPWLNPPGRAIGKLPQVFSSGPVLAYVWAKRPGESDAPVRGGPNAGEFWPQYAIDLVKNAK
jgi:endoglucanase